MSKGRKKTYEELYEELRFMSAAYKVLRVQRDMARANEKILQERLRNLRDTLASFTGRKAAK